jgi:NAD+ kinase
MDNYRWAQQASSSNNFSHLNNLAASSGMKPPSSLDMKRVLVLSKISRYDFEKLLNPHLNESELADNLKARGTNIDGLRLRHNVHKECTNLVVHAFQSRGIETRVVDRFSYNQAAISWADLVVSTGGDGTFLLAASKILDSTKPLIGVNSEPAKSEGHLCLPKKYRSRVGEAVDKILQGQFEWMFRKRIRITLSGKDVNSPPIELHAQRLNCYELRFFEDLPHCLDGKKLDEVEFNNEPTRILPVLALNEVRFVSSSNILQNLSLRFTDP